MQIGNVFVDRLAAGGPALGAVTEVPSPTLAEVDGGVGPDFLPVGHDLDAVRTVFGEWIDAFDGGRM
jgi:hypothetical protein